MVYLLPSQVYSKCIFLIGWKYTWYATSCHPCNGGCLAAVTKVTVTGPKWL